MYLASVVDSGSSARWRSTVWFKTDKSFRFLGGKSRNCLSLALSLFLFPNYLLPLTTWPFFQSLSLSLSLSLSKNKLVSFSLLCHTQMQVNWKLCLVIDKESHAPTEVAFNFSKHNRQSKCTHGTTCMSEPQSCCVLFVVGCIYWSVSWYILPL